MRGHVEHYYNVTVKYQQGKDAILWLFDMDGEIVDKVELMDKSKFRTVDDYHALLQHYGLQTKSSEEIENIMKLRDEEFNAMLLENSKKRMQQKQNQKTAASKTQKFATKNEKTSTSPTKSRVTTTTAAASEVHYAVKDSVSTLQGGTNIPSAMNSKDEL